MPLPSPILDDRSYQQLRDELVRRIPVYAPEWTDHNASDPGVTLIELFAFLGENLLFRFNQIPEAAKLAYLKLLRIPLRPATPSRAMLVLTTESPGGVLVKQRSQAFAGNLAFETSTEVQVWPLSALAVARLRTAEPRKDTEPEVHEYAVRAVSALGPLGENQEAAYYETVIVKPEGNGAPIDFGASVDGMLWVAILKEKGCERKNLAAALVNIGFVADASSRDEESEHPYPDGEEGTRGRAVEWQVSLRDLKGDVPSYRRLHVESDTTRGLTEDGIVRLRLPRDQEFCAVDVPRPGDPERAGTGDLPPLLDDETDDRVLFWLRAYRLDGGDLPAVRLVAANVSDALQCATALPEFLGRGDGQANQEYPLVHNQVLPRSLVVQVEEPGGWTAWSEVADFFASAPDSRHFTLDGESGRVRFGNGEQGRAPQIGERLRAVSYRYGGGAAGNVPAKAVARIAVEGVKIKNPLAAWGGADRETIEEALDRIPGELRRRDRAVTARDFKELALQTPGADVGRAECLARFHWPTRASEKAGVVTVVIWPEADARHPNAPVPDARMRSRVCAWLNDRRLITTELYVVAPVYRQVAVSVALRVKPGYGVEAVRRWVELVIRQYLAPLPPYGPSGQGWPLGHRIYGPELEAAALQVEGVECVEQVDVVGWNPKTQSLTRGIVELERYEVPELTEVQVVEGKIAPPADRPPSPPPNEMVPVPIPILREEC